jgi:hypothetical protein
MAAHKMAAVKVTPPNDFPLGLIRSHMVVIHLFLMLCDLQRVVKDLCPTLYMVLQEESPPLRGKVPLVKVQSFSEKLLYQRSNGSEHNVKE